MKELGNAGANAVRVWLHIDGSRTPNFSPYDSSEQPGRATGMGVDAVADLKWLLRLCHSEGIKVMLSLWSHDILAVRRWVQAVMNRLVVMMSKEKMGAALLSLR